MNPIKNIEIRNFKSIRHAKIEDCRRINVFIGYPNTGKSNLLEAIGLFSSFRLIGENFKFNDLCRLKRFTELFFNKDYKSGATILVNDEVSLGLSLNQSNNLDIRIRRPKLLVNNSGLDLYFSTVDTSYAFRDNIPINEQGFKEVLEAVRKYEFKPDVELNRKTPLALAIPFGNNLLEVLHGDSTLRKDIAGLFDDYNLKLVIDDDEIIFLKYLSDDTGVSIPYHLIAETLKRLIFYKAAIMSNKESILLFEEPEAHMFPPYISKFTSDIWYYKENQYFITTHSPFVVTDFLENMKEELAIYVVEYKKESGETRIARMTEEQVHEAYQYGIDIFFNLESITK